ncbi:hypothetical protein EBZ37_11610, partial [bacterium]|nr:hypothetical protein [bacterium]
MKTSFHSALRRLSLVILLSVVTSCAHSPAPVEKQTALLDGETLAPEADPNIGRPTREIFGKDIETIAILGTNDIHGNLAPLELKTREPEGTSPLPYTAAGVSALASYIGITRQEFDSAFLWLDAGDEFQGTIESNLAQGAPIVDFFNQNLLHAAAIGNHEFDYGPSKAPG